MRALKQNNSNGNLHCLSPMDKRAETVLDVNCKVDQNDWCLYLNSRDNLAPVMSSEDTANVLDIVSDLQNSYQTSAANHILRQIERSLDVSKTSMGLFDATGNRNLFVIGHQKNQSLTTSVFNCKRCAILPRKRGERFEAIFDFGHTEKEQKVVGYFTFHAQKELNQKQKQLVQMLIPYLYSYLHSLHFIADGLKGFKLTSREKEVIEWMKEGKDNWAISKILGISERTIKFHNCNIFKKLGVNSRNEVICWYYQFFSSVGAIVKKKNREMRKLFG